MAKQKPAIDPDLIRELAQLLEETGLSEIEVERDGQRVRVAKQRNGNHVQAPASPPLSESPPTSPARIDHPTAPVSLANRSAATPACLFIADETPLHKKLGVFENRG